MPLENEKPEIVGLLSKYVSQIKTSISQVTGSASIKMPQYLEPDDEKAIANKETIDDYENYLVVWTDRIKEVTDGESKKTSEPGSASAVIEFWRARSGTLSTLYQELTKPEVTKIKNRVRIFHERSVSQIFSVVTDFEVNMK